MTTVKHVGDVVLLIQYVRYAFILAICRASVMLVLAKLQLYNGIPSSNYDISICLFTCLDCGTCKV